MKKKSLLSGVLAAVLMLCPANLYAADASAGETNHIAEAGAENVIQPEIVNEEWLESAIQPEETIEEGVENTGVQEIAPTEADSALAPSQDDAAPSTDGAGEADGVNSVPAETLTEAGEDSADADDLENAWESTERQDTYGGETDGYGTNPGDAEEEIADPAGEEDEVILPEDYADGEELILSIETVGEDEMAVPSGLDETESGLAVEDITVSDGPPMQISSYAADLPDYDIWMANTMISGFEGTQGLYPLFSSFQDPVYRELGGYLLEDKALLTISAEWSVFFNSKYRNQLANEQKYIYEIILMNYLIYDAQNGQASLELGNNETKFSMELYAAVADELNDNVTDYIDGMSVQEACDFYSKKVKKINGLSTAISTVQDLAESVDDLVNLTSEYLALQKAKEERIELLKAARDACGSSNPDFTAAADEIISVLQSTGAEYLARKTPGALWEAFCKKVQDTLEERHPILALAKLGLSGLDACFDTSNKASNNLKLALLYSTDCYMRLGMINSASRFSSSKTAVNGQSFLACFQAYVQFQIYGNTYARTWLEGYLDGGTFSNFINMLFFRNNIQTAEELLSTCDSQTAQRERILELIDVYAGVYETLYTNFDVKVPVPVTGVAFANPNVLLEVGDPLVVWANVVPENADNKNITYKSSDPSVISVPEKGGVGHAKGPGTATITAVTEDGGFVATQTVMVQGRQKPGPAAVRAGGSCGESAAWRLYDNGLLYVYGKGKATNMNSDKIIYRSFESTDVRKVVFADEITVIEGILYSCDNLEEVSLPSKLNTIGTRAFSHCTSLKKINLPGGLTAIGEEAFYGCTGLSKINLPSGLTTIGEEAFYECTGLSEINLPSGLTTIGEAAFQKCTGLNEINLPNGLTAIGNGAFSSCTSLTEINLPDGLTTIGGGAFSSCTSLKEIDLPDSVTSIGAHIFSRCTSLVKLSLPTGLILGGELFINRVYTGKYSQDINLDGLDCPNLERIELPDGLIKVGAECKFGTFPKLKEVILPDSVTTIEGFTFKDCTSLMEFKFPDGITMIGAFAFYNCSGLTELKLPDSITRIGHNAFRKCTSLTKFKLPDGITTIEEDAFAYCTSLTKLDLPSSLTMIDRETFEGCTNLKELEIPNGVTTIGYAAFRNCTSLTKLDLPSNLTMIESRAFKGCINLKKIEFPLGLTEINYIAFEDCTGLKKIVFEGNAPSIGEYAFSDVTATVIYPADNPTWTEEKRQNYGGDLTWISDKEAGESSTEKTDTNSGKSPDKNSSEKADSDTGKSLGKCKITLPASVTYTGKDLASSLTVKSGDKKLKKGTDYTVTFKKNKKTGKVTVTIKGKGKYSGTVKKTLRVVVGSTKLSASRTKKNAVKLTWKKVAGAKGYVIQRKDSKGKWVNRKVIKKGTVLTYTDNGAKKGKVWKYRIRAYCKIGKEKVYGSWTTAKSKK